MAGLSGATLGNILQMISTLLSACVVALALGWKLALVCIATIPILISCGFYRFHMLQKFQRRSRTAFADSARYASEAINAIRTVASLTREQDVLRSYEARVSSQLKDSAKSIAISTNLFAASQVRFLSPGLLAR